jgi:hypothetical protein
MLKQTSKEIGVGVAIAIGAVSPGFLQPTATAIAI